MLTQPWPADLLVPAGTPQTAPVSLTPGFPPGYLRRVVLTIPSGPNGLAGWQLLLGGSIIVPYTATGWVVGNDHVYTFPIDRQVNAGQVQVQGYNTGVYPHTFHCLMHWEPLTVALPVTATLATSGGPLLDTSAQVAALSAEPTQDELAAQDLTAPQIPDLVGL